MNEVNSLTEDFKDFISKISLDAKIENDIISKHKSITDMIKNDMPIGYKILNTRLSGSYAKHTVINEYKNDKLPDVDIIVIIEDSNKSAKQVNEDFFEYFKIKKGKVVSNLRQQSNSIGLEYNNISVDIVIAIPICNSQKLKIASYKNNEWIESNSLNHISYMEKQNKNYESFNYHDLMKLFKYLNKECIKNSLKSYTLEQLIHKCAPSSTKVVKLHEAFNLTLNNILEISNIFQIRDCLDINKKGYDDKDIATFDKFKEEIKNYYKLSNKALNGNRTYWQNIFGSMFPKQISAKVINGEEYDKTQTPWCN